MLPIIEQEGQRCPKRQVAQAAISLVTAVITFRNKERNVGHPVKVNVLGVLRNVKLVI